jgi:hypothetical protein
VGSGFADAEFADRWADVVLDGASVGVEGRGGPFAVGDQALEPLLPEAHEVRSEHCAPGRIRTCDQRIRRWTDVVITPELAKLWPTSVRSLLILADSSVGRWIPKGIPRPAEPLSFGSATSCVTGSILSVAPVPIDGLH